MSGEYEGLVKVIQDYADTIGHDAYAVLAKDFMRIHTEHTGRETKTTLVEILKLRTRAVEKYGAFASPHEAYGVLAEEVAELLDEIRKNDRAGTRREALDVAAVALRLAEELE